MAQARVYLLLHPSAYLIDRPAGQRHDVESVQDSGGVGQESVQDSGGVGQLVIDGVLAATERIQRGDLDPSIEGWRARADQFGTETPGAVSIPRGLP